jgi:hypothetical protein
MEELHHPWMKNTDVTQLIDKFSYRVPRCAERSHFDPGWSFSLICPIKVGLAILCEVMQ